MTYSLVLVMIALLYVMKLCAKMTIIIFMKGSEMKLTIYGDIGTLVGYIGDSLSVY
jgi:hypothetical protein